ncbi:MAG: hypothetical protein SPL80_02160 [Bacilli bacterium]|nr:hypothetical protein [Bacilli bacterium]
MKEDLLRGLTEEQIAKLKKCKSGDEVLRLAKEQGVELTDEQLEVVSGGSLCAPNCPVCGTKDNVFKGTEEWNENKYVCKKCGTICGDFGI